MFDTNQQRTSTNTSSSYDAHAAERMQMDYLKKEKQRRDVERYKMEYEAKKREFDMHSASKQRFDMDKKRIEMELSKYKTDILGTLRDEKRYSIEKTTLTEEEKDINKKIQLMEVELQQLKNKSVRLKQDRESAERKDKELMQDLTKRDAYVRSLQLKLDEVNRKLDAANREVTGLSSELSRLKNHG